MLFEALTLPQRDKVHFIFQFEVWFEVTRFAAKFERSQSVKGKVEGQVTNHNAITIVITKECSYLRL